MSLAFHLRSLIWLISKGFNVQNCQVKTQSSRWVYFSGNVCLCYRWRESLFTFQFWQVNRIEFNVETCDRSVELQVWSTHTAFCILYANSLYSREPLFVYIGRYSSSSKVNSTRNSESILRNQVNMTSVIMPCGSSACYKVNLPSLSRTFCNNDNEKKKTKKAIELSRGKPISKLTI